jgi:RHS repeat-associated protein
MKTKKMRIWFVIIAAMAFVQTLPAQQTGYPPFGSFQVGNFDGVNLQDLNVTFSLPVIASSGRGINFQLPIVYNSLVWNKYSTVWSPNFGWQTNLPQGQLVGGQYYYLQFKCYNPGPGWVWGHRYKYGGYAFVDPAGTVHSFPIAITTDDCWGDSGTYSGYASDASGYYGSVDANYVLHVTGPAGTAPGASSIIDANGNYITQTVNGNETDYTDSVGRKAAKVITNTTSILYEFLDGTGTNTYKTATLTLASESIKTNFACGGVTEYTGSTYLPTELDIPTPSGATLKYIFTYEPTPGSPTTTTGRLQKVTLPTGGTYEYDYGAMNDGVSCTDGSVISMTRKVTDGSTVGTWQYTRVVTGNPAVWQNTVTDAASNDTVYTFGYPTGPETMRQLYSGTGGSRTIQRTLNTTWASNGTPATSVTILEDNSTQSETDTTFDSNGLLDLETEYDWGSNTHGAAMRTTTLTYLNSSNYTSRNIIDHVQTKIVRSGGATGTIQNRQDIAYDGATITSCPTSVAQHDDTHFGCSMNYRGNPTSVTTWLDPVTPGQPLTTTLTYDVFGNVLQASGGGASQIQSSFSSTTQYAEPDSTSVGGLTTYFTYYSDTGQLKTVKDPNNQQTSYGYDFLRRSTSVTRPDNFQVTTAYNDSAFTTNVTSPIDGSRSVQQITAFDAQGLPYTQTVEDSNNTVYSIVQTNYDAMGRAYRTSNPYTTSPQYWTTTSFDGLSRVSSLTDPGTGTLSFTYTLNDVLQTLGPKPSGENTKSRQMEYDGAGRLLSVCEVTGMQGSGSCAQKSAQTGYLTTYAYNVLDELTHVTQSSTQTRTYAYDALGRMTSETNPEIGANGNGTITYAYDSDATCGSSTGDLVKEVDAAGNVICSTYDALHRLTWVKYPSGPNAANSYARFYWYDAIYVDNTSSTAYLKGRLSAAGTCTTPTCSVNTHEWTLYEYAYDATGRQTDVWERTPNSGGTYHTTATYWPNGAVASLSGIPGEPTYTFGVDGEGRNNSATQGSNALVSSVLFNPANQITRTNLGDGDHDDYQYDSNTGRMTQYSFTIGATPQTESGTLTWNPNGTLQQLAISNPFNSNDNQICSYAHDDLARLSNANCGSVWSQSFNYEPYGNITKTGTVAWAPGYNPATNRYTLSGTSYDANGNLLTDTFNTYAWDSSNLPVSIGSRALTYDAFGREVEKSSSGTYQWTAVYTPVGRAAFTTGQSLNYLEFNLPGGIRTDAWTGSQNFVHGDWLGSTRLESTSGRTVLGTQALAPFGEPYSTSGTVETAFAGTIADTASGTNDADARRQNPVQGRWISPDPAGLGAVDLGNPQSLNRYAYVDNDPVDMTDPTGLCPKWGPYSTPYDMAHPVNGIIRARCRPTSFSFPVGGPAFIDDFTCENGDCGSVVYISIPINSGPTYNGQPDQPIYTPIDTSSNPCSSILGKGGVLNVSTPFGTARAQFDPSGFLTGFALPLTGTSNQVVGGFNIQANTMGGVLLNPDGSVAIGFSNPIRTPGVISSFISSVTFSPVGGGQFTSVIGAVAVGPIPFGRRSTPSPFVQGYMNQNVSAIQFGNTLYNALKWAKQHISCSGLAG